MLLNTIVKCKKIFLLCPKYISRSLFPRTTAFGRGGGGANGADTASN